MVEGDVWLAGMDWSSMSGSNGEGKTSRPTLEERVLDIVSEKPIKPRALIQRLDEALGAPLDEIEETYWGLIEDGELAFDHERRLAVVAGPVDTD